MKLKIKSTIATCFIMLLVNVHAQNAKNDIIYDSSIPLTQGMMEQQANLVQMLLDLKYTPQQKEKHFQLIKDYWIANDFEGMQSIQSNLQFYEQLLQLTEKERKATVQQVRSSLIMSLIEDAETKVDSRWYLQNYYAEHPPLIAGTIPFIQETADALIDCEYFINQHLKGIKVTPVTKEQRVAAYNELGKQWITFDTDKKKKIMQGASQMQLIFYRWSQMDALGKATIKLQYVGEQYLTLSEKNTIRNAATQNNVLRNQQWGMMQSQLNHMKESTDIIMGRGIRWDPSRNRYVQDGGIVTEFW